MKPRIAVLLASILVLSACSSTHSALVIPDDGPGAVCGPADTAGEVLVGVDFFRNDGTERAEISQVSIMNGENIGVRSYGVLPNGEEGFRGVLPPSEAFMSENRTIAEGEEAVVQVRLALGNQSEPGRAEKLEVEYRDSGSSSTKSIATVMSIEVVPPGQTCG